MDLTPGDAYVRHGRKVRNEAINIGELLVTSALTIDPYEASRVQLNANFHNKNDCYRPVLL